MASVDYDSALNEPRTDTEQSETPAEFRVNYESLVTDEEFARIWGDLDPGPMGFRMPPASHIVYFVGGDEGPVKIGWTQQPIKERLKCIQSGSPVKLRVLATANRYRIAERHYHRQFAHCRLHGEWFERTPEIEAEIARLNANPSSSHSLSAPSKPPQPPKAQG